MSINIFVQHITQKLEECRIPYMISGSLISSFYGEPRTTMDIDIVIDPSEEQVHTFTECIKKTCYISSEAAISAFKNRTMFNVIDYQTSWKADLIIRRNRPFSVAEFSRKRKANILNMQIFVVSPEDSILSKLEWANKSLSEKQYRDLFSVASLQQKDLDFNYIEKWAKELGVTELLGKLISDLKLTEK